MPLVDSIVVDDVVSNVMSAMAIEDDANIRTIVEAIVTGIFDALKSDAVVTGTTATQLGPQPLQSGKIT